MLDSVEDLKTSLDRAVIMLDEERQKMIEHVAMVIRDTVRVANRRSNGVGDLALMAVIVQRAKGPL